jgi:hypothetical protein
MERISTIEHPATGQWPFFDKRGGWLGHRVARLANCALMCNVERIVRQFR